jgi:hypothetical protein
MAAQAASTTSDLSPAASVTSSPAPSSAAKTDAARLRQAIRGIRALPVAQRPAAFAKLKADVLAGEYGTKTEHDLTAIDAVVASDPAGLRNGLLRLAAVHPHHAAGKGASTPEGPTSPSPSASTSS